MTDDTPVTDKVLAPDDVLVTDETLTTDDTLVDDEVLTTDDLLITDEARTVDDLLDDIYRGQERISQAEIQRRAVAAELPAVLLTRISAMPEGEYAIDEAADLLGGTIA